MGGLLQQEREYSGADWIDPLLFFKKSHIRETKHLSTDADSSTDAIGGWTKNTPKSLKYLDWDKAVITGTKFRMG